LALGKNIDVFFRLEALKTMIRVFRIETIHLIVIACMIVLRSLAERIFLFRNLKAGFG
jgi:hypothetical protein